MHKLLRLGVPASGPDASRGGMVKRNHRSAAIVSSGGGPPKVGPFWRAGTDRDRRPLPWVGAYWCMVRLVRAIRCSLACASNVMLYPAGE